MVIDSRDRGLIERETDGEKEIEREIGERERGKRGRERGDREGEGGRAYVQQPEVDRGDAD